MKNIGKNLGQSAIALSHLNHTFGDQGGVISLFRKWIKKTVMNSENRQLKGIGRLKKKKSQDIPLGDRVGKTADFKKF